MIIICKALWEWLFPRAKGILYNKQVVKQELETIDEFKFKVLWNRHNSKGNPISKQQIMQLLYQIIL